MAACAHIKADGTPCNGTVAPGAAYCWAHDPAHAAQRQANARKGGKAAGNGRPAAAGELGELRQLLKDLIEQVQDGATNAGKAYALNALLNTRLRLISVEREIKEQEELEARIAALEASAPPQGRRNQWGT